MVIIFTTDINVKLSEGRLSTRIKYYSIHGLSKQQPFLFGVNITQTAHLFTQLVLNSACLIVSNLTNGITFRSVMAMI